MGTENEIKPFTTDVSNWKCPKCDRTGKMSRGVYNKKEDRFDIYCSCGFYQSAAMYPADHQPPEPPWEPKVGERVICTAFEGGPRAGYVVPLEVCDSEWWQVKVRYDDGTDDYCRKDALRPETREDRVARAREIVAKARPGDRFRVIEKPVNISGLKYDSDYCDAIVIAHEDQPPYTTDLRVYREGNRNDDVILRAWNIVPLPAEEQPAPEPPAEQPDPQWVWTGEYRIPTYGEWYLNPVCGAPTENVMEHNEPRFIVKKARKQ